MRHFEKLTGRRLDRSIHVEGPTLRLSFGYAADTHRDVTVKYRSARQAKEAALRWDQLAAEAGFAEFDLQDQQPASVSSVLTGRGARVRTDDMRDVFVSAALAGSLGLKQGLRVLLSGFTRSRGPHPDFMFGSPWRAREVAPFPKPLSREKAVKRTLSASVRARLLKQAGPRLKGSRERMEDAPTFKPGELIFGHGPGVYRFLGSERWAEGPMATFELVLNTRLAPAPARSPHQSMACFCEKLPETLARELHPLYGVD